MTNHRRAHIPCGTYFFTLALADRAARTLVDDFGALRWAYRQSQAQRRFHCDAIVVLPNYLHAIWTLPEGDADYSTRWGAIKARFTREIIGRMGFNPILPSRSAIQTGLRTHVFCENTLSRSVSVCHAANTHLVNFLYFNRFGSSASAPRRRFLSSS
jgi:putative transposase